MRVEDGDVCRIPQPNFFFNVFWTALRVASHKATLAHHISLSFISVHGLHLQGVERRIASLFLITDKGFCHIAVPYAFFTGQLSLNSAHCSQC